VGCLLLAVAVAVIPRPDPEHAIAPRTHWAWPLVRRRDGGGRRAAAKEKEPV
jgi:hypothetical protein